MLLLAIVGCSSDGRLTVSGTVTLDGKPLESGTISFQPAPGEAGHSAGGRIENGEFRLPAEHGMKPGKYLVVVQTFRPTGRMNNHPIKGKFADVARVKYNEAGKLEATVAPGAANHFDFQLTSAGS